MKDREPYFFHKNLPVHQLMNPFRFCCYKKSAKVIHKVRSHVRLYGGESLISVDDHTMLYEITAGMHGCVDDGFFIEFGTYHGASSGVIALGLKKTKNNAPLLTIDQPLPTIEGLPRMMISSQVFESLGLWFNVAQVMFNDGQFWEKFLSHLPIRFIFLDTNHGYEDVRRQLQTVFPNVVSGGFCLIHDYDNNHIDRSVKAVNEFIDEQVSNTISCYLGEQTAVIKKV